MKINPYDEHIVIFGQSGTGKTTLAKYLIKQIAKQKPVWIWDYNAEYELFQKVKGTNNLYYGNLTYLPQEGTEEEFSQFCQTAYDQNNLTVVIEEVQEYANKFYMPPELAKIVRTGRRRGVTYIAISQRPAEVHNAIISNSHHRFIFRLDLPPDIIYLKRWVMVDENTIKTLPNHFFYYYSPKYQVSKIYNPIVI
ncbi:MAG: DUF87 domain-containing protein [Nitrososphaeria archaeon]